MLQVPAPGESQNETNPGIFWLWEETEHQVGTPKVKDVNTNCGTLRKRHLTSRGVIPPQQKEFGGNEKTQVMRRAGATCPRAQPAVLTCFSLSLPHSGQRSVCSSSGHHTEALTVGAERGQGETRRAQAVLHAESERARPTFTGLSLCSVVTADPKKPWWAERCSLTRPL